MYFNVGRKGRITGVVGGDGNIMRYFYLDEAIDCPGRYVIRLDLEFVKHKFPTGTIGSYDVLVARVLNLPYYKYLRFARDVIGAELQGKGHKYITVLFPETKTTQLLIKILNARMRFIMDIDRNPVDYKLIEGELKTVSLNI